MTISRLEDACARCEERAEVAEKTAEEKVRPTAADSLYLVCVSRLFVTQGCVAIKTGAVVSVRLRRDLSSDSL